MERPRQVRRPATKAEPTPLRFEVTEICCVVPPTTEQWDTLERHDFGDVVLPEMVEAGACRRSVEYNGHFGRNVFFKANDRAAAHKIVQVLQRLTTSKPPLKSNGPYERP